MSVSVVLPVYNREQFLVGAVDSILQQSCENWDLIIVNDGSTDGTAEVAQNIVNAHPDKVRLISKPNGGVASARNEGIRAATGDLIAFIDSDDRMHPEKLARQMAVFDRHPDASFIYTGYELVDVDDTPFRTVLPDARFQGDIERQLWLEDNEILGPTMMVRREALVAVGLFDEQLVGAENLDLRIKLARRGPVHFVDGVLYYYRKHDESLTAQVELMFEQHLKLIQSHLPHGDPAVAELRRQVLARHWKKQGDLAFSRHHFAAARRYYLKSWSGSRAKRDTLIRTCRCFLGQRGNRWLRQFKKGSLTPS